MKKWFILLVLSLCMTSVSFAQVDQLLYNKGQLGTGNFHGLDNVDDVITTAVGLTDGRNIPLVHDLDADGTKEVVIFDDDTFSVFSFAANTFTLLDSYDIGTAEKLSNMILFDIDGDGYTESIFAGEETEKIYVMEYNGTALNNHTIDLSSIVHTAGSTPGQMMLQCRSQDDCLLVFNKDDDSSTAVQTYLFAQTFNSTSLTGSQFTIETTGSAINQNYCFPNLRHIEVADVDDTGDDEYIFTYAHILENSADEVYLIALDVTGTTITQAWKTASGYTLSDVYNPSGSFACRDWMEYITAPLSFNIDTSKLGNEVMYGLTVNPGAFRFDTYESDGSFLDDHPETVFGDGVFISNPFKADAWESSTGRSACVVGYETDIQEIYIACIREEGIGETRVFKEFYDQIPLTDPFNVSQAFAEYNGIAWAVQDDDTLYDGFDPHEVLTAYGIFNLGENLDSCIANSCDLSLSFENPIGDSACIAADVESIGSHDLLCMSNTALVYIDDKLSNQPATITQYSFNPCPANAIIKINTTMEITVTVTDGDQGTIPADSVNSRVSAYNSLANEIQSEINNVTSASPQTHYITLNKTGNNFAMLLEGWDNGVPSSVDSITQIFSVGLNGVELDDSQCSFTVVETTTTTTNATAFDGTSLSENSIYTGFTTVGGLLGLGTGITYLIFVIAVMTGLFLGGIQYGHALLGFGASMIIGFMLIILGTLLSIVNIGITITIVIVAIAVISMFVRRLSTGSDT